MIRGNELINEYNLEPLAGNALSINSLFNSLFNPLLSASSVFYILINQSPFGEIFLCHYCISTG